MSSSNGRRRDIGFVYKAERFCVHDGPGIRTALYFRGCPLACLWCCNPESRSQAETTGEEEFLTWRRPVSSDELVDLACRDLTYYRMSEGGVTLTGGEVLAQPEFAADLLEKLRIRGIHTAMETSGYAGEEALALVLSHLDLVLLDIKHMDSEQHKALTGCGNERILHNARTIHDQGVPLAIRLPLIPGSNDSADNLHSQGTFIKQDLPAVKTLHILGYHDYARNKYRAMGLDYPMEDLPPATENQVNRAAELLGQYVPDVRIGG